LPFCGDSGTQNDLYGKILHAARVKDKLLVEKLIKLKEGSATYQPPTTQLFTLSLTSQP